MFQYSVDAGQEMNVFRALIPCALQRSCWAGDDHMSGRMGASASNLAAESQGRVGPMTQAARLSTGFHPAVAASGTSEQLAVVVRYDKSLNFGIVSIST